MSVFVFIDICSLLTQILIRIQTHIHTHFILFPLLYCNYSFMYLYEGHPRLRYTFLGGM